MAGNELPQSRQHSSASAKTLPRRVKAVEAAEVATAGAVGAGEAAEDTAGTFIIDRGAQAPECRHSRQGATTAVRPPAMP